MSHPIRRLTLALVAALLWPSAALRGQPAAPSILVIENPSAPNPFGGYLSEILRAEGLKDFAVVDLADVDAGDLAAARLVLLAETPLSGGQATLFTDYIGSGGRFIAMRPDAQLAPALGLAAAAGTTTDGYVLIDQSGPGAGLQSVTLPFRGAADHYTLNGATAVAALYATQTTAAGFPAVVRYNHTAAWTFDLARSTAYTRQGDPALAGVERDGEPLIRTTDVFYGNIDLQRIGIPHADVQMRLLTRLISTLLADAQPTPRLWYFPGTARTLMVTTGDSHTSVLASHTALVQAAESHGARLSLYFSRYITLPPADVNAWLAAGHDLGLHPYFTPDGATVAQGYATNAASFTSSIAPSFGPTERHHSVEWQGWVDPVAVMPTYGIRMDLSYYGWGPPMFAPDVQHQAHGYITGSGLPMRFIDAAGVVQPVYQQSTALIDEQLVVGSNSQLLDVPSALAVSQQLIDDSQAGGYSAIGAQFHADYYTFGEVRPWVDGTLAYAQSLGVPMWSALRWLTYVEARAATTIGDVVWNAPSNQLSFTVAVPAGAPAQSLLVPSTQGGLALSAVTVDGQPVATTALTVNGEAMRAFDVAPLGGAGRVVHATYGPLPTLSIANTSVTEGHGGSTPATLTVSLSSATLDPVTVAWATQDGSAVAGADYTAASGQVTIAAGATSQTLSVAVLGDVLDESDETFSVVLSSPVNATIATGTAAVTVTDDDPLPALTIDDVSIVEGDAGTSLATFTVTVTPVSGRLVSASLATAGGTATSGVDFSAASGSISISPGLTSATFSVPVIGDILVEPDETFTVTMSAPVNAVIADAVGAGTILNDDALPVAAADAYSTPFQTTLVVPAPGVLANDTTSGFPVTGITVVSGASHGTLSLDGVTGGFTFVPAADFAGGDSFSYRVTTSAGDSAPATVTITVTAPAVVQPPRNLRVVAVEGGVVTFRWTAPPVGPAATAYVLEGGVVPGQTLATVPITDATPAVSIALPAGVFYVRARAISGGETSAPTADIQVTTGQSLAPSTPGTLLAATAGSTVYLEWTPTFTGGVPAGYVLAVSGTASAAIPLPATPQAVFTGVPGGTYALSLRAVNAAGASSQGAPVSVTVPEACSGAPDVPRDLLVFVAGGITTALWEAPSSGSAAAAYVVEVEGLGGFSTTARQIGGRLPAGTYRITVRGVNPCGTSVATAPATIVVP